MRKHTEYQIGGREVTLSVLSGGDGYSTPRTHPGAERTVEAALIVDGSFVLPSQVGLSKSFDRYWDGNEEYGGVAPYMKHVVFQNLQYKLGIISEQKEG